MSRYAYSRLSAQDNDFLRWESQRLPMHGVGVQIFECGPLARGNGVDFNAVREAVAAALPRMPRYRQKLAFIPGTQRAVWVDDEHFQLDHHLRHVAVAHPGAEAQLRRLVSHIAETPLDRGRPLWESWVIEGLASAARGEPEASGDQLGSKRFAFVTKAHHCMFDGAGGMQLISQLLSRDPEAPLPEAPRFIAKTPPSAFELKRDDWLHWAKLPFRLARGAADALRDGEQTREKLRERTRALGALARFKLAAASETPLNGKIGPHRSVEWTSFALAEAKDAAHAHGASLNDFVLAVVAGALRTFFDERGIEPGALDFRASCPVNIREEKTREKAGNFVSSWVVELPLGEIDPVERLHKVRTATRELKDQHVSAGIQSLLALHEWLPIDLQALSQGAQNLVVTNVPGPQHALYLRGARMESMFALAPLIANVGLTIAATSYDGKLCFGLNADEDRVPDLHAIVRALRAAFAELAAKPGHKKQTPRAAGVAPGRELAAVASA
ncbi:MAG: wax ester/triacylglycerol synthase family O-acyltransferase [Deltaproteobacteria bacterium]|nr:wax ester/triacylglycerol synthase family O-acyltransferase [Deltaproteobacteria bacterium]